MTALRIFFLSYAFFIFFLNAVSLSSSLLSMILSTSSHQEFDLSLKRIKFFWNWQDFCVFIIIGILYKICQVIQIIAIFFYQKNHEIQATVSNKMISINFSYLVYISPYFSSNDTFLPTITFYRFFVSWMHNLNYEICFPWIVKLFKDLITADIKVWI